MVLPPKSDLHTALAVPEATAHMTMSNGLDDTSCQDVRQEDENTTSRSRCIDARVSLQRHHCLSCVVWAQLPLVQALASMDHTANMGTSEH